MLPEKSNLKPKLSVFVIKRKQADPTDAPPMGSRFVLARCQLVRRPDIEYNIPGLSSGASWKILKVRFLLISSTVNRNSSSSSVAATYFLPKPTSGLGTTTGLGL